MDSPKTFAEIIDLWPTAIALAGEVGVTDIVVRAWKRRGIPGEYWARIVAAAKDKPFASLITLELLARLGEQVAAERKGVAA
jgi:hypothetical protein